MKTMKILLALLLFGTISASAQEYATRIVKNVEPNGFSAESLIDVTVKSSTCRLRCTGFTLFDGALYEGDLITRVVFKGYNPGQELTRSLRVTAIYNNSKPGTVVYEGGCTIPHGGTAEECIPLLEVDFSTPQLFKYGLELLVECTGEATATPVYFECQQDEHASVPVALLTVMSETGSLEGSVDSQDNKPVSGAHVRVFRYNLDTGATEFDFTADTDAEGHYSVGVEDINCTYTMTVTADGYADYVLDRPFFLKEQNGMVGMSPPSDVTLFSRIEFTANKQATIILPDAPDPSWGKYYRLDRWENRQEDGNEVIFVREYEPRANTPYVIFPVQDFSISVNAYDLRNLPEPGAVLFADNSDEKAWGFHGSYQSRNITPITVGSELLLDDTPDCVKGDAPNLPRIGAFRAYLQVCWNSDILYDSPKLVFTDKPTGVYEPKVERITKAVYDLQGRRVSQPRKGVYIENGKKAVSYNCGNNE